MLLIFVVTGTNSDYYETPCESFLKLLHIEEFLIQVCLLSYDLVDTNSHNMNLVHSTVIKYILQAEAQVHLL